MAIDQLLKTYRERADSALEARIPDAQNKLSHLHQAMRYACLQGGKRVRPALVYATGVGLGADLEQLDAPAAAVEMVHAYSLVHDDLPAMDDDDLRRGQPTAHIKFDEATAILAGDALQPLAFEVLCHDHALAVDAPTRLQLLSTLLDASGHNGMVYGQAIDLAAVEQSLTLEELQHMHRHKTGAIIKAAVLMGAQTAGADANTQNQLSHYADAVGLAFQIADDILDVVADTETLGKRQGADANNDKPTYVSLLGLEGARQHAQDCHQQALNSLAPLPDTLEPLAELSAYIVERTH
ncbi:MAG: (2E,6E)-farnesyl diphosphate synthase [Granulosicoccaceae bacterium]